MVSKNLSLWFNSISIHSNGYFELDLICILYVRSIEININDIVVDHSDGKFLGTMECQWFSSRYHCGQWFFNGFFTSEPSLSMVFHISTIGINGFSNGFSISDDGFSMVFYR